MIVRILLSLHFIACATSVRAEPPATTGHVIASVEYPLKTPRARDPALGGARDKVSVSVWIPEGVKVVRGGICNPFSKGDNVSKHWQAACRHWQFAYVQVDFDAVKKEEFALLKTGLTDLAKKTGHPELENLPLCFIGMSRGGGMSMQLGEMMPDRTIAVAPVCLEVGPASDAARRIPVMTIFGEKDGFQMEKLLTKLPAERKLEARFGIAVQWDRKHEFALANNLAFVFFDDVIAGRLPKQPAADKPMPLTEIPLTNGWLGDFETWGKGGKMPTIAAWNGYKGDRDKACWFPSERTAAVWQAFVGASKDVIISAPPGLGDKQPFAIVSARKPLRVNLTLSKDIKPTKVTIWDADRRLAETTESPWTFMVSLKPGIHSIIAMVEDSAGRKASRPHTIVVEE
ncbi:MAG: hypothetical protein K8T89_22435 [Planctomycetes bacterium]|nr:hypothetical protein [Planctomycetota bacterium]